MKGATILNISDLSNIEKINELILNESSFYLAFQVTNDYVFIYEVEEGLHVFDITDPINPIFAAKYNDTSFAFGDFCVKGNYAYIALYDTFKILNLNMASHGFTQIEHG